MKAEPCTQCGGTGEVAVTVGVGNDRIPEVEECPDCRRGGRCVSCDDKRYVLHAGDLDADAGYHEIRTCPTCSTGERIGRSDIPIITEAQR